MRSRIVGAALERAARLVAAQQGPVASGVSAERLLQLDTVIPDPRRGLCKNRQNDFLGPVADQHRSRDLLSGEYVLRMVSDIARDFLVERLRQVVPERRSEEHT